MLKKCAEMSLFKEKIPTEILCRNDRALNQTELNMAQDDTFYNCDFNK